MNDSTPAPHTSRKTGSRLRMVGMVVLLLGICGAALRFGTGARHVNASDDIVNAENSKKAARQIEMNFGKMGLFTDSMMQGLQDPATQALIIMVTSILVAAACFYVAQLQDRAARLHDRPG